MKKMNRIFFILLLLFSFSLGCVSQKSGSDDATSACILECQKNKATSDYVSGPCLSNEIKTDWVCDIAHNPRLPADNQPENQCTAFREGHAHHFVELDENCTVIKVY